MAVVKSTAWLLAAGALTSCITVNIYFPAAAAEKVADTIIQEVWSQKTEGKEAKDRDSKQDSAARPEQAALERGARQLALALFTALSGEARAASPDFNASSPEIEKIKAKMSKRFGQMAPHFDSGAIGLTADGLVAVRDAEAVPMAERAKLNQLVKAENADRHALYAAIAAANNHPEWQGDIQKTFAGRWISQAQSGWYYQENGSWRQK